VNFFKRLFKKEQKEATSDEIIKEAVIRDFSLPKRWSKKKPLTIQVQGYFSHLGWQLAEASAIVKGEKITLQVLGKMKAGLMAAQAIKPFDLVVEVEKLKPGTYQVKAKKGTDKVKEVIIE